MERGIGEPSHLAEEHRFHNDFLEAWEGEADHIVRVHYFRQIAECIEVATPRHIMEDDCERILHVLPGP